MPAQIRKQRDNDTKDGHPKYQMEVSLWNTLLDAELMTEAAEVKAIIDNYK